MAERPAVKNNVEGKWRMITDINPEPPCAYVHAHTYTHVCQHTCNHVCCVYTKRRKKQKANKCSSSEKKETMKGKEGNRRDTGFKADERNF